MFKQGYVRLLVASVAAIGLHALLLIWSDNSSLTVATDMKSGSLQVALLSSKEKEHSSDMIYTSEVLPKAVVETYEQEKPLQPEEISFSEPEVSYVDSSEPKSVEPAETGDQEEARAIKQLSSSLETALVPIEIQATILANVSYPRQARRRGWEGEAELGFNINSQSVQHVTMLASTGYPILDRAARRGLLSVRSLPLIDGSYRLPVVFRLQ